MTTAWRWLVAGLVAGALLFGTGWWLGHRSVTSTAAERDAWQARADSVLGVEREQHQRAVAAILDSVGADTAEVARLRRQAAAGLLLRRRWQAEADTLTAMLVVRAGTARDSIDLYQRVVVAMDSAVSRETARGDSLAAALDRSLLATARLLTIHRIDSTRIAGLEALVVSAPQPPRYELRLMGVRVRPGGAVVLDVTGRVRAGLGLVVTR